MICLKDDAKKFLFADDVAFIEVAEEIQVVESNLNQDLLQLSNWSGCWKLFFSVKKFQLLVFGNRQYLKKLDELEVEFEGHRISSSPFVKYLGFKIDGQLKWNAHIEWILL